MTIPWEKYGASGNEENMRYLFYLIGKSASGKDTIYEKLLDDRTLDLCPLVPYTTRPIREGEKEGAEYHFTDQEGFSRLKRAGKVIEDRTYDTVFGPWTYFTVDDGLFADQAEGWDMLGIGTLESFVKIQSYYGKDRVIPLYIEVDDGIRLMRALKREMAPGNHKYDEMCRRFLADQKDFSEEKLAEAGIGIRFSNDGQLEDCLKKVAAYIGDFA